MVDEAGQVLSRIAIQGHLQGFKRVAGLQAVAYAIAYYLAAVAVCNQRQETEARAAVKRDVGDVAGYEAARAERDQVARKVGVQGKAVAGVCGGYAAPAPANLKAVLLYDVIEAVVTDAVTGAKALAVHVPQLIAAYARVELPYFTDELYDEALKAQAEKTPVIVLVVGLLADTK